MKVTTRISSGYGLLLALFAGLAVYQVITIRRMYSINQQLTEYEYSYTLACINTLRDRDKVEEYTWRSLFLTDAEYWNQLRESQETFEISLGELARTAAQAGQEQGAVRHLAPIWETYKSGLETLRKNLSQSQAVMPQSLREPLDELRAQIDSIYQHRLKSMETQLQNSRKTARTAATLSGCLALAALAVSLLIFLLIYRSIASSLAHLTEGTRALAQGKLFYRLDTSRSDEFSQIARDINKIVLQLDERARRPVGDSQKQ